MTSAWCNSSLFACLAKHIVCRRYVRFHIDYDLEPAFDYLYVVQGMAGTDEMVLHLEAILSCTF